jgi:hypothetical protein
MWNVIAGFFTPLALSVVIQTGWPRGVQSVLAFGVAAVLAVVTTALEAELNFEDWVTSLFVVLTATISTYYGIWKPTGVAPSLEQSTTLRGR